MASLTLKALQGDVGVHPRELPPHEGKEVIRDELIPVESPGNEEDDGDEGDVEEHVRLRVAARLGGEVGGGGSRGCRPR